VDGMANRLLFDLFSNFTFFLDNPVTGDGFLQHDSRLQEAANAQYQKPHTLGTSFGTFFTGVNFLGNQINLKLAGRQGRVPTDLRTWAQTDILNTGFYGQENLVLFAGKLRLDGGLRYDTFNYRIQDRIIATSPRQDRTGGVWQPKGAIAYTPDLRIPFTLYANYGQAVTSANARALISDPASALTALTKFSMVGWSLNYTKFSIAGDAFLINRTLETVYAADNGTTEFTTPSRSSGWEAKTSYQFKPWLSWNGSVTKVMNAFYRDTSPRIYIDRAPHFTAYSAFTVSDYKGWSGSLRVRAINRYILNGEGNGGAVVPGHTVWDFSASRAINRYFDLNIALDNLFDKFYYETFEMYTSALKGQSPLERVHGTPGYPRTVMAGVTIHLFPKAR
jgi:outer membrane receptor protein involved in Fe transport